MRLGDAGAFVELDERNRCAGFLVSPEHLLVHAHERLFAPGNAVRLDQDFIEARCAGGHVGHRGVLSYQNQGVHLTDLISISRDR